jgi:tetratricopeptide (TPR) repeat protein
MKRILVLFLNACVLGTCGSAYAQEHLSKPGAIGDAYGFVVDADSQRYLTGAHIQLLMPPNVQKVSGGEADTINEGFYKIKAPLGTVSTQFAIERIFELSPIDFLFGAAKKTERHINVSQLNVKVTKEGYKPYVGPLRVNYADLGANRVWLSPVKLVAVDRSYLSYASDINDLGKIESISLSTATPSAGEEVTWHATTSRLPLAPGEKVWASSQIMGTLSESRAEAKTTGDELAFDGKIPMQSTQLGLFSTGHKKLKPGVYRLLFSFADAPQMTHLATWRFVAVGCPADKKSQVDAELNSLNSQSSETLSKITPGTAATLRRVAMLLPVPETEPNPILNAVAEFKAGDYEKAAKTFRPYASYFPSYEPIFKDAAAVQKNPADFKARAELSRLCRIYEEDAPEPAEAEDHVDRLTDVKKAVRLPAMPSASKPEDKLDAAQVLIAQGDTNQALTYLQDLVSVPAFATRAHLAIAELAYERHDIETATSHFETAYASKDADKVSQFYPFLHYALLLTKRGEAAKAEPMFAKALARGRNRSQDYSRPSSQTTFAGHSYTVYSAPLRSGTVGYAYPEGALVQLVLSNYEAMAHPDADWMTTSTLGRALAELGCSEQALPLLSAVCMQRPDEQFALESYAVALKLAGDEIHLSPVVKHLLELNSHNPTALSLTQGAQQ